MYEYNMRTSNYLLVVNVFAWTAFCMQCISHVHTRHINVLAKYIHRVNCRTCNKIKILTGCIADAIVLRCVEFVELKECTEIFPLKQVVAISNKDLF